MAEGQRTGSKVMVKGTIKRKGPHAGGGECGVCGAG